MSVVSRTRASVVQRPYVYAYWLVKVGRSACRWCTIAFSAILLRWYRRDIGCRSLHWEGFFTFGIGETSVDFQIARKVPLVMIAFIIMSVTCLHSMFALFLVSQLGKSMEWVALRLHDFMEYIAFLFLTIISWREQDLAMTSFGSLGIVSLLERHAEVRIDHKTGHISSGCLEQGNN